MKKRIKLEQVISLWTLFLMAGLSIQVGYSAFYKQFLVLETKSQIFVTILYTVICGSIVITTLRLNREYWVSNMMLNPKETLQRAVSQADVMFPAKLFFLLILLASLWIDVMARDTDESGWWELMPWWLIGGILISSFSIGFFWLFHSTFIYIIFKVSKKDMRFGVIFRLSGYTFIYFLILFLVLNSMLIFFQKSSDFLFAFDDFVKFWLIMFLIQFIWSTVIVSWSLFNFRVVDE